MSVRRLNGAEFHDLASAILQTGHLLRFQASGGSMQPFIRDGDTLEVAPLAREHVRYGDVLLVETCDGKWLAHRVVKIGRRDGKPAFLIKGDACSNPDGWLGIECVLGRVVVVEHDRQLITLTSKSHQCLSGIWVMIAPWIPKFSWLPERLRQYLRRLLFGGLIPE
jgi:signal peptidase